MTAGLLESESTGGAVARGGFEYQDAFVLQHLPRWLAQGAFSHVVSEAVGDVEVCYHAPGGGILRVLHEAKDYALTSTQFWAEIARFEQVHETSPAEFPRFALVCRDFKSVTAPLVAMIGRLRGVGASFDGDSVMLANARREIVEWVTGKGQSEATAQFVIDRVEFVTYGAEHADAAFAGEVEKHLPALNLRTSEVAALRDQCKVLVAGSSLGPVHRASIETAVINRQGDQAGTWATTPTAVLLVNQCVNLEHLGVNVTDFTGPQRSQRSASDWSTLSAALTGIGDFIKASRPRRCVALDGKQRMSVACLVGYALSATRGFLLDIEHNGHHYRTDNHDKASGTFFDQPVEIGAGTKQGVVCIGFPTAVGADVAAVAGGALMSLPRLELSSGNAIAGMATLNLAVAEAKQALMRFRSAHELELVHLFIKAPSAFAMTLGHRLNGVGCIQLHDWVDGCYVQTATLHAG
ncbi:MAG: dsDNA nuclease domain-containing protein [Pseudomonadota bacterium]